MKTRRLSGILAIMTAVVCITGGCAGKKAVTDVDTSGEKLTFSVSLPDNGNQYVLRSSNINEDEWVKKFNEKFNANVTFMHRDSKRDNEEMQMMFASGEFADVIGKCAEVYFWNSFSELKEQSYICKLTSDGIFEE